MPVLLTILAAVSGALYFILRARNSANAATELMDVANDVRLAARRFGFRRQANVHPAETIEEPEIAIAGIASAFIELDDLPTSDAREALNWDLSKTLELSKSDADELATLGRWMVRECGGAEPAISRLSRKLARLKAPNSFKQLLTVLGASASDAGVSHKQTEALDDIKRAFRIK